MPHTLLLIVSHMDVLVCQASQGLKTLIDIPSDIDRAVQSTVSSTPQDRIDELIDGFKRLRDALDSGVLVQVLDLFCSAGRVTFRTCFRLNKVLTFIPQTKSAISRAFVE